MNLALRHPQMFCKVVALSGRYDLTRPVGPFEDLFSGHYDEDVYFITPNHFLPNLNDPRLLDAIRRMDITLAVGEQDPFHESNRLLSQALAEKGAPHRLAVWPGEAHRARYWREIGATLPLELCSQQATTFLLWTKRMLIRVQQGKVAKDRDAKLSPRLLEVLRRSLRHPPRQGLRCQWRSFPFSYWPKLRVRYPFPADACGLDARP